MATSPTIVQDLLDAYDSGLYNWGQDTVTAPGDSHTFRGSEQPPNTITLRAGAEDMIRCSPEGFWVRGVKVAQDDKEAESVYNAFKQWLVWAQLTGQV